MPDRQYDDNGANLLAEWLLNNGCSPRLSPMESIDYYSQIEAMKRTVLFRTLTRAPNFKEWWNNWGGIIAGDRMPVVNIPEFVASNTDLTPEQKMIMAQWWSIRYDCMGSGGTVKTKTDMSAAISKMVDLPTIIKHIGKKAWSLGKIVNSLSGIKDGTVGTPEDHIALAERADSRILPLLGGLPSAYLETLVNKKLSGKKFKDNDSRLWYLANVLKNKNCPQSAFNTVAEKMPGVLDSVAESQYMKVGAAISHRFSTFGPRSSLSPEGKLDYEHFLMTIKSNHSTQNAISKYSAATKDDDLARVCYDEGLVTLHGLLLNGQGHILSDDELAQNIPVDSFDNGCARICEYINENRVSPDGSLPEAYVELAKKPQFNFLLEKLKFSKEQAAPLVEAIIQNPLTSDLALKNILNGTPLSEINFNKILDVFEKKNYPVNFHFGVSAPNRMLAFRYMVDLMKKPEKSKRDSAIIQENCKAELFRNKKAPILATIKAAAESENMTAVAAMALAVSNYNICFRPEVNKLFLNAMRTLSRSPSKHNEFVDNLLTISAHHSYLDKNVTKDHVWRDTISELMNIALTTAPPPTGGLSEAARSFLDYDADDYIDVFRNHQELQAALSDQYENNADIMPIRMYRVFGKQLADRIINTVNSKLDSGASLLRSEEQFLALREDIPRDLVMKVVFNPNVGDTVRRSILANKHLPKEDWRKIFNASFTDDNMGPTMADAVADKCLSHAELLKFKEGTAHLLDPDKGTPNEDKSGIGGLYTGLTAVKFDTFKARLARDHILARSPTTKNMHEKELSKTYPGDWSKFRDKHGLVSADLLDSHIDNIKPSVVYNISHAKYRDVGWDEPTHKTKDGKPDWNRYIGKQRHSDAQQRVFQINLSNDIVNKLCEAGLYHDFARVHKNMPTDSHPNRKGLGLGWVRWTGDFNTGIFIDEIQTDMYQMLREAGLPNEKAKQIQDICYGGKAGNWATLETFCDWLRTHHRGTKLAMHGQDSKARMSIEGYTTMADPDAVLFEKDLHGTKVDEWGKPIKALDPNGNTIPDEAAKKGLTGRPPPVWAKATYEDMPKKMGWTPGKYDEKEMPAMNNPHFQGRDVWTTTIKHEITKLLWKLEKGSILSERETYLKAILETCDYNLSL